MLLPTIKNGWLSRHSSLKWPIWKYSKEEIKRNLIYQNRVDHHFDRRLLPAPVCPYSILYCPIPLWIIFSACPLLNKLLDPLFLFSTCLVYVFTFDKILCSWYKQSWFITFEFPNIRYLMITVNDRFYPSAKRGVLRSIIQSLPAEGSCRFYNGSGLENALCNSLFCHNWQRLTCTTYILFISRIAWATTVSRFLPST